VQEFLNSPLVAEVLNLLNDIGFSPSELLSKWTLIQIVMIIGAYVIAQFTANRLEMPLKTQFRKLEGQRALFEMVFLLCLFMDWLWRA